jgi:SAM-dependent methyltransferase
MTCPLCASRQNVVFDKRARVPVHQNGRCESRQEALATPAGRLEMTGCLACGFIWNAAFDPDLLVYDARYENDQTCSDVFRAHVASRARRVARGLAGVDRPRLVEVGCGQGTFYRIMAQTLGALPGPAAGFDPAWRGKDGEGPAGARLFSTYFDRATAWLAGGRPDAVISRHTIEHVPDPVAFLSGIRDALGGGAAARLFVETPCSNWILDNRQIQDLFYEHCSLFTAASLARAIERAGFGAAAVEHVFEGQYLWAEAGEGSGTEGGPAAAPMPQFDEWRSEKARYVARWRQAVADAGAHGPVYLWGAGSKGVTFSLLVDPDGDALAGAVDVNPAKQGCFLPLTAVPVLPPEKLPSSGATVIVMNPAYQAEIEAQVRAIGRDVDFLSLAA